MDDVDSGPGLKKVERHIFLTFDDGPNPYATAQVLELLAEYRVAAAFCVIGVYAAKHPELIRRIVGEGHDVVNHTMTHPDLSRCKPDEVRREIAEASRVIKRICPQVSLDYLRAPYGIWTSEVRAAAARCELMPLNWSVDPRDWSHPGVNAIVETVLADIRPGGIILLHDGCPPDELPSGSHSGLREQTVMALRHLIPALHERGFVFKSVSDYRPSTMSEPD